MVGVFLSFYVRLIYAPKHIFRLLSVPCTNPVLQQRFIHPATMGMWYHVSEPNSYLAITGAGIDKVKITKKAWVYPMQKVRKISITPFDFSMSLQAMTSEKLQFSLPAVFTIGPDDTTEALQKYAVLLTGDSDGQVQAAKRSIATGRNHVQDIVKGIIEGETRSIVSNM